ncbi:MAG: MarR family winged helix-turn-helix transcriptional regulator [Bacteroidales bacterium]
MFILDESITFLINKTAQKFKLELGRKLKQSGLDISSDQWSVMMYLADKDGPSQTELAYRLHKDRSNLTRILDLMEKAEYIRRSRSTDDRREFNVFITDKGRDLIPVLRKTGDLVMKKALKGSDTNEIKVVKSFLNKLFANLD